MNRVKGKICLPCCQIPITSKMIDDREDTIFHNSSNALLSSFYCLIKFGEREWIVYEFVDLLVSSTLLFQIVQTRVGRFLYLFVPTCIIEFR